MRKITMQEVEQHNSSEDCWVGGENYFSETGRP